MKAALIIIVLLASIGLVVFEIWNQTIDSEFLGKLIVIVAIIIVAIAIFIP